MKKVLFSFGIALLSITVNAQSIKLESGNLGFLSGVKAIDVTYVYPDNMIVGKSSQTEYVEKKVNEYNSKEPGRGDKWLIAWNTDRKDRYEPMFEQLLFKNLSSRGI